MQEEFCHYDFDKKEFVNPNLQGVVNQDTVDTKEVEYLKTRLELVNEMLEETPNDESLKDRVELLKEMLEEKSSKKLLYGGKLMYSDKIDDSGYKLNLTIEEFIKYGKAIHLSA